MPTATLENSNLTDGSTSDGMLSDWESNGEGMGTGFTPSAQETSPIRGSHQIGKVEVAEVTAQLSIMAKSGVDLASSLSSLASQCQRPALASVLTEVRESVLSGSSFSDALRLHPEVFDPTFVATVAAGEASGKMADVLLQLATMQKNEIRRNRELKALLTYPVLLLVVSSSVLAALVVFVLPRFAGIFEQYEMPLPVLTQFFLAISEELISRWWLWGTLTLGMLIGLLAWRKSTAGRRSLDRFWIRGPMVGEICCGMCIGTTCRLLGLMLNNGVTLLESLRLTRNAIKNSLYQGLLYDLEDAVINGQGLASVLTETDFVPPSAKEMIVTAESTGNLNEVTTLLGDYYEEESEAKLRQLVGVLEPAITVFMGAIVAVVVLSVMLPVFNLSTFAAGGH